MPNPKAECDDINKVLEETHCTIIGRMGKSGKTA
jgi:hypothetical protein